MRIPVLLGSNPAGRYYLYDRADYVLGLDSPPLAEFANRQAALEFAARNSYRIAGR